MLTPISNTFSHRDLGRFQLNTDTLIFRVVSSVAIVVFTQIVAKVLEKVIPYSLVITIKVLPGLGCSAWIIYKYFRPSENNSSRIPQSSPNSKFRIPKNALSPFESKNTLTSSPGYPFGHSPNKNPILRNTPSDELNNESNKPTTPSSSSSTNEEPTFLQKLDGSEGDDP